MTPAKASQDDHSGQKVKLPLPKLINLGSTKTCHSTVNLNDSCSEISDRTLDTSEEVIEKPREVAQQIISDYGSAIISSLRKNEKDNLTGLEHHEIKGRHRKQMVEWMRDVLEVFKSPIETFFLSVTVMDRYFNEETTILSVDELHEIGVACILIASKFSEIEPLTVDLMHKKAAHGKISCEKIIQRERDILNRLSFEIAIPTVLDCFDNFFSIFSDKCSELKAHEEGIKAEAI